MQQSSSSRSRQPRAERTTTSCTECRRRKQKCNQAQPCNNCSRRFPPPKCEYIHKNPNGRQQTQGLPYTSVFSAESGRAELHVQSPLSTESVPLPSPLPGLRQTDPPESGQPKAQPHEQLDVVALVGVSRNQETVSEHVRNSTHRDVTALKPSRGHGGDVSALAARSNGDSSPVADLVANLGRLAVPVTKLNNHLITTFLQYLHRFKGPLDSPGERYDNPFVELYAPWCFQSPLLAPVALHVAATTLSDTKPVDSLAAIELQREAYRMLNHYLDSPAPTSTSDEVVSAMSQMILKDWYYGDTNVTLPQLRKLRELVESRGGFAKEGVGGLVSKHALVIDCFVAISLETTPLLQHGFLDTSAVFTLHEPLPDQLNPAYNSPFAPYSLYPSFSQCKTHDLHPEAARILDHMQLLFETVLRLASYASQEEIVEVKQTASIIHDRIWNLHETTPDTPPPEPSLSIPLPAQSFNQSSSINSSSSSSGSSILPQFISQSHDPRHLLLRTAPQPDFIYATIRQTALLYSRAISVRQPLSMVCPTPEFIAIWSTLWKVSLRRWHSLLGVFLWIVIALLPTGGRTQFATMLKSFLHLGSVQMGIDHWEVSIGLLRRAVGVMRWLAGDGKREGKDGEGDVRMGG